MTEGIPLRSQARCETGTRRARRLRAAATALAGLRAFRLFCTPGQSRHRAPDHDRLVERARFHLREAARARIETRVGPVETYVLAPDRPPLASVIIVHGWTGEASFMSAIADFLRRRGFRVVLLDLPAHGASPGAVTSLMACAEAVGAVAEALGPIRFAVGHSVGGLAALVAGEGRPPMPRACPFEGYVLVSMPDRFADVTGRFARELGLGAPALRAFERRLEGLAHRSVASFTGTSLLTAVGRPALLLHARDDEEVAFADAERMARDVAGVQLEAFDGLGHRMILYAPPVVRAAASYLTSLASPAG